MEIIERYLRAIEFWLPKQQKHDIIAEISEDIHSQIEERENDLGRKLNQAELETLIKQRGRPVMVANRYLPQQYLIGPVLFPLYVFVLKICAFLYLPVWSAIYIVASRLQHPVANWADTIGGLWSTVWTVAFTACAVITLVFAILQRVETRRHFLEDWNPRKLPPVRNVRTISRVSSAVELAWNFFFGAWWLQYASLANIFGMQISFAPAWAYYFWGSSSSSWSASLSGSSILFVHIGRPPARSAG